VSLIAYSNFYIYFFFIPISCNTLATSGILMSPCISLTSLCLPLSSTNCFSSSLTSLARPLSLSYLWCVPKKSASKLSLICLSLSILSENEVFMISETTANEVGGVNYRREYDCSSEPSGDELRGQRIRQSLLNKCRLDFRVSKEVSKPKFTRSALF
jgi:hypothetical protein